MVRHELAVQQLITTDIQPRDQPRQCDLRGIAAAREHAFTEEGGASLDTI
jgi:hypothetical protein